MKYLVFTILTFASLTISKASNEPKYQDDIQHNQDAVKPGESQINLDKDSPKIEKRSLDQENFNLQELVYGTAALAGTPNKISNKKQRGKAFTVSEVLQRLDQYLKGYGHNPLAAYLNENADETALRSEPVTTLENQDQPSKAKGRLNRINLAGSGNQGEQNKRVSKFSVDLSKLVKNLSGDNRKEQNRYNDRFKNKSNKKIRVNRVESFYPKKQKKQSVYKSQSAIKDRSSKDYIELLKKVIPLLQKDSSASSSSEESRNDKTNVYILQPNSDLYKLMSPRVKKQPSLPQQINKYKMQLLQSLHEDVEDDSDEE